MREQRSSVNKQETQANCRIGVSCFDTSCKYLVADGVEAVLPALEVAGQLRPGVEFIIEQRGDGRRDRRGRGSGGGFNSLRRGLQLEEEDDRRVETQGGQHDL